MEKIIIQDLNDNVKNFLDLPTGILKNIKYDKLNNKQVLLSNVGKEDDNIYFSSIIYNIAKNKNSYYLRNYNKFGISFKNNKVNIWFGKKIEEIPNINKFYEYMNWNFIHPNAYNYITKSSLEKLFKGKITSTRDLLKHYAKSVRIKCSTEFLYHAVVENNLSKIFFYKFSIISKNPDHFLQYYMKNNNTFINNNTIHDITKQFDILNKKFDFKWSEKRISEEHNKATYQLMEYEMGDLSEIPIQYTPLNISSNIQILSTQKRIFEEGKIMSHCIYTNYWYNIRNGNYMAFSVKLKNEKATLGVNIRNKKMQFNQLYLKGNQPVSTEMRTFCANFIEINKDNEIEIINKFDNIENKQPVLPIQQQVINDDFFADF